jgi:hypothetical protein
MVTQSFSCEAHSPPACSKAASSSITTLVQRQVLKYIMHANVDQAITKAVISRAMKVVGVSTGVPPQYPGRKFVHQKTLNPLSATNDFNEAFVALLGYVRTRLLLFEYDPNMWL